MVKMIHVVMFEPETVILLAAGESLRPTGGGQIKRGHSIEYLVTLDILIRSKSLLANFNIISFLIRICHFKY